MARINIEECWWSDPRRTKLLLKIGFAADSAAVNMWRTGQEFWSKNQSLVPKDVFDKLEYSKELIEAGLADVRESFVYVRGSSEYLTWLQEKREQARMAGKKSAERRRDEKGRLLPAEVQRKSSERPTKPNAIQPSGSGSVSGSKEINTAAPKKRFEFETHQDLLDALPSKLISSWRDTYDEGWILGEVKACFEHYTLIAPGNKPGTLRGWRQAVNGWIKRSKNKVLKGAAGFMPGSTICGFADV